MLRSQKTYEIEQLKPIDVFYSLLRYIFQIVIKFSIILAFKITFHEKYMNSKNHILQWFNMKMHVKNWVIIQLKNPRITLSLRNWWFNIKCIAKLWNPKLGMRPQMTVQTYVLMNILYWHSRYLNPCHAATCASRNYEPRFDQQKATHITRHRDRYICWEKLKTDNEQTHVHVIFFSRTYMRQSSVGMMAASEVEPPPAEMTQ